jgi:hypothetical protein
MKVASKSQATDGGSFEPAGIHSAISAGDLSGGLAIDR